MFSILSVKFAIAFHHWVCGEEAELPAALEVTCKSVLECYTKDVKSSIMPWIVPRPALLQLLAYIMHGGPRVKRALPRAKGERSRDFPHTKNL